MRLINNTLKFWQIRYLIVLLFFTTVLLLFLEQESKVYVPIFFFILTVPVYIYYSFWQLINISKYLKEHHNFFYEKNKSYRRYKALYFVFVPIFGFVDSIKKLNDRNILGLAVDYKISLNSVFFSFVIIVFILLLVVL